MTDDRTPISRLGEGYAASRARWKRASTRERIRLYAIVGVCAMLVGLVYWTTFTPEGAAVVIWLNS